MSKTKVREQCKATTVESLQHIQVNSVPHAGVLTHRCGLDEKHEDEFCRCPCGKQWKKFGSVK